MNPIPAPPLPTPPQILTRFSFAHIASHSEPLTSFGELSSGTGSARKTVSPADRPLSMLGGVR